MRKGFLVFIAVTTMLVGQCGVALGKSGGGQLGDACIYLDGSLTTQNDLNTTTPTNNDWGSAVIGLNASVGRVKVTTESYSKVTDGSSIRSSNTKVSYALVAEDYMRLEATVSYHKLEISDSAVATDDAVSDGYLVGLDVQLGLTERTFLETNIEYTNSASWDTSASNSDASILNYKVRLVWMPWQSFGFSIGYRSYTYSPDAASSAETNFSGMFGGLTWRFNNIHLSSNDRGPVQIWGK